MSSQNEKNFSVNNQNLPYGNGRETIDPRHVAMSRGYADGGKQKFSHGRRHATVDRGYEDDRKQKIAISRGHVSGVGGHAGEGK